MLGVAATSGPICWHCRRCDDSLIKKIIKCTRCKIANYCSKECRQSHKHLHRKDCEELLFTRRQWIKADIEVFAIHTARAARLTHVKRAKYEKLYIDYQKIEKAGQRFYGDDIQYCMNVMACILVPLYNLKEIQKKIIEH